MPMMVLMSCATMPTVSEMRAPYTHAGIDVASLRVGAEPELAAGRLLGHHQVGIHHRIGVRKPRREHADQDRDREQRAADDEIGAELHART